VQLASALRRLHEHNEELYGKVVQEAEIGGRKAYYLLAIDRHFSDLGIPESRLQQIGWTKLALIGPHLSATNKESLPRLGRKAHGQGTRTADAGRGARSERKLRAAVPQIHYARFAKLLRKNGAVKSGRGLFNKEKALMKIVAAAETQPTS
jgi:hypothetical protein